MILIQHPKVPNLTYNPLIGTLCMGKDIVLRHPLDNLKQLPGFVSTADPEVHLDPTELSFVGLGIWLRFLGLYVYQLV